MSKTPHSSTQHPLRVIVMGGLGNQLFQLAAAISLSCASARQIVLDRSWYDTYGLQDFLIDRCFNLNDLGIEITSDSTPMPLALKKAIWATRLRLHSRSTLVQTGTGYDPRVFEAVGINRLVGYFQSWRYFENDLHRIFTLFRDSLARQCASSVAPATYPSANRAAMHLRLGDYETKENTRRYGGVSTNYIRQSIKVLRYLHPAVDTVSIFSNDISRAQSLMQTIDLGVDHELVEPMDPVTDLIRMSNFSSLVISNSSFSWWAGALPIPAGPKTVLAPTPWQLKPRDEGADLRLPHWIAVPR